MTRSVFKLVVALLVIAAIIIIAMAVIVILNFSHLDLRQGIILGIVAIATLFLIMAIFIIAQRSLSSGEKAKGRKK